MDSWQIQPILIRLINPIRGDVGYLDVVDVLADTLNDRELAVFSTSNGASAPDFPWTLVSRTVNNET